MMTKSARFFSSPSKNVSPSHSSPTPHSPRTPKHTFNESMMEENIEAAESIISKWDLDSSSYTKLISLFQHNRNEAKQFLTSVKYLRQAMHFLVSYHAASDKLVLAQKLMQIAMKRLEKEFYMILSAKQNKLDPESFSGTKSSRGSSHYEDVEDYEVERQEKSRMAGDDEIIEVDERVVPDSAIRVMADLKSIADCMISSGYGKECVKIYKVIRMSIVDEGLHRLGVERYDSSQINKMTWEALDNTIKNWLTAMRVAVRTLFHGERVLCDHVFSTSQATGESCFSEITSEGAMNLFRFPQLLTKTKRLPEKIFTTLELHEAISEVWPDAERIFSYESTSHIKLQALSSLVKLGEYIHGTLSDFQASIQKNSTKAPVLGGKTHPLTLTTMDYLSSLADYDGVLSTILADNQTQDTLSLPEFYLQFPNADDASSSSSSFSLHLAWIILVLLCKLDNKSKYYKDVSLSYLFLANNLHFMVEKVRTTNLRYILGDDWISMHSNKVSVYASNYEALAWSKVLSSLPDKNSIEILSPEMAKQFLAKFNAAFEEAYTKQASWMVEDGKLRDELKVSIARKLVPIYREFYEEISMLIMEDTNMRSWVKFSPDDLGNYLSDLFHGNSTSGNSTSSSTSSIPSQRCLPR